MHRIGANVNKVTPVSLGYPPSVINKNSTLSLHPQRIWIVSASAFATILGPVSLWIHCMKASTVPLSCFRRNYTARLPAWRSSPARLSYYLSFPPWQHPPYCHLGLIFNAELAHNRIFRWLCFYHSIFYITRLPLPLTIRFQLWLLWLCRLSCSCDSSGLNQRVHWLPFEVVANTANTPRWV